MVYLFLNLRNASNAANPRKDRNTNAVIPVGKKLSLLQRLVLY